jgi:hypothetical protein
VEDGGGITHGIHDGATTDGNRKRVTIDGFVRQDLQQVGDEVRVVFSFLTTFEYMGNHRRNSGGIALVGMRLVHFHALEEVPQNRFPDDSLFYFLFADE